jgi:hypothetical protein
MSNIFKGLNEAIDIGSMQAEYRTRKAEIEKNAEQYSKKYSIPTDDQYFAQKVMQAQDREKDQARLAQQKQQSAAAQQQSVAGDKQNIEALKQQLQKLKGQLDPNYQQSDDYTFVSQQQRIANAIQGLEKRISAANVSEETIHVGHRNSKGDWVKTSTHSNYADAEAAMKELEKAGKKGVQHRYDNKGNIDPGAMMTARPDSGMLEAEQDLGPKYQSAVAALKQMAKQGPRKTVWDPVKRVYKTVPVNPPKKEEGVSEGSSTGNLLSRSGFKEIRKIKHGAEYSNGRQAVSIQIDPSDPDWINWALGEIRGKRIDWIESGNDDKQEALHIIKTFTKQGVAEEKCPECGGPMFSDLMLAEKKDACYNKVRSRYKVWPSAYASGALVQCRKKGASNWGNKSESMAKGSENILPRGTAVTVLHKGKQVPGKIVRYDAGKGGYSNAYVVDIGEYESIFVPTNKIQQGVAEEQLDEKCWDTHKQVGMKKKGDKMVPNCVPKESAVLEGLLESKNLDENLRKWFKEKWVRFGPDGKIRGACARGDDSEGKPKCLPQAKAHSLGKKGRKYAASKKRREDPNPERKGKAINVATKKKTDEAQNLKQQAAIAIAKKKVDKK